MSLVRSALVVGLAAALSRVTGFVRDVLIAAALGAGPVADAFLVAFRLPNLVRRILGEGGFNAGFVPLYARIKAERGAEAAAGFASGALSGLGLVLVVLVALVEVAAGGVVLLLAAGYAGDPATLALSAHLTRLAFPFVAAVSLASLLAAYLNAERRFAAAALAPVAVNVALIAALLVLALDPGLPAERKAVWLAASVSAAGFVQLAVVAFGLRAAGPLRLARPRLTPDLRRLAVLGLPALAASGAAQLMILASIQVASFTPSAVSWLYYADRVFQLPLGFVGVAVGLVLLPEIAGRAAAGDRRGVAAAQNRALEASLLLTLPAALALGLLAYPIAAVLFERGAFGPEDSIGVAMALAGLSPGLPFAAAGKVLSQTLFAREMAKSALVAGGFGVLVTVAASSLLVEPLGVLGVGLGAALGLAAHAVSLALILRQEGLWSADARLKERCARMGGAALAMGAALFGLRDLMAGTLGALDRGLVDLALLVGFCGAGLAVYAVAAWLFGAVTREDWAELTRGG